MRNETTHTMGKGKKALRNIPQKWLLTLFFLSFAPLCFTSFSNFKEVYFKVPILKVNVYLMGMEEIDKKIYANIDQNFQYLNQEFEGYIGFEMNNLHLDVNSAWLPDLYSNFYRKGADKINQLVNPIEEQGAVNLYVFDTYCEEDTDQALMGFTPVLRSAHYKYKSASPGFDRIFIAYEGIEDQSTLVHEMGHFLGQKHPWELTEYARKAIGLINSNVDNNHMSYGHNVNHFTRQQLEQMRKHALEYRSYLADKIISVSLTP